jgi:nitrite reductase (NO-forming)
MKPGVFIYHCATPMIPYHLSHGMYGLMVVEPPGGWPKVDKEFYVMEGDIYLKGDRTQSGVHEAVADKMVNETPDFVVFNGSAGSLSKARVESQGGRDRADLLRECRTQRRIELSRHRRDF